MKTTKKHTIENLHIFEIVRIIPRTVFNREKCVIFNALLEERRVEIAWKPNKRDEIYVRVKPYGYYANIEQDLITILEERLSHS